MRIVAVIPARLGSTRLARKPLREIAGVPMVGHVYRAAAESGVLAAEDVVIATDSDEIIRVCRQNGWNAEMTSASHRSGTERVNEIAQRRPADVYLNIQGDEPLTRPEHIRDLIAVMQRRGVEVGTLVTPMKPEDFDNPNAVKAVTASDGRALFFSRAAIPFDRDGAGPTRYKHLGFYGYRREVLARFCAWPESTLEIAERLEQLRFLEHGVTIHVGQTEFDTISVDTEADLVAVEQHLRR